MKNLLKIGISSLVLVGAAMLPAFANDPMTESLRGLRGEEFDKKFLSHMIDHHQQGVEMAQLAQHHAQSSGVKRFAAKTAQSQQKDIEEMKRMKGDKSSHHASGSDQKSRVEKTRQTGSSHASSSHASGTSHESAGAPTGRTSHESSASSHHASSGSHEQMKKETMSKLESAQGAQFDQVFVDEMLKHHKMGKEMAQLAQQQGSREDVRSFAAKTIKQQERETQELKQLQK
jgi:uncharacterized protein (DUF305 family)